MRRLRWQLFLALIIWASTRPSDALPVPEDELDSSTRLLGSSVVTSISVVSGDGKSVEADAEIKDDRANGRKASGIYELPPSPAGLLRPDKFQFYTYNEKGDMITRQMTEHEIQSLIAAGGGHLPVEIQEPQKADDALTGGKKVADVVQKVQNVLKSALDKPTTVITSIPTIPGHANEEWSNILPSIMSGDASIMMGQPQYVSQSAQTTDIKHSNVGQESIPAEPAVLLKPVAKPTHTAAKKNVTSSVNEKRPIVHSSVEDYVSIPETKIEVDQSISMNESIEPTFPEKTMVPVAVITTDPKPLTPSVIRQPVETQDVVYEKVKIIPPTKVPSVAVTTATRPSNLNFRPSTSSIASSSTERSSTESSIYTQRVSLSGTPSRETSTTARVQTEFTKRTTPYRNVISTTQKAVTTKQKPTTSSTPLVENDISTTVKYDQSTKTRVQESTTNIPPSRKTTVKDEISTTKKYEKITERTEEAKITEVTKSSFESTTASTIDSTDEKDESLLASLFAGLFGNSEKVNSSDKNKDSTLSILNPEKETVSSFTKIPYVPSTSTENKFELIHTLNAAPEIVEKTSNVVLETTTLENVISSTNVPVNVKKDTLTTLLPEYKSTVQAVKESTTLKSETSTMPTKEASSTLLYTEVKPTTVNQEKINQEIPTTTSDEELLRISTINDEVELKDEIMTTKLPQVQDSTKTPILKDSTTSKPLESSTIYDKIETTKVPDVTETIKDDTRETTTTMYQLFDDSTEMGRPHHKIDISTVLPTTKESDKILSTTKEYTTNSITTMVPVLLESTEKSESISNTSEKSEPTKNTDRIEQTTESISTIIPQKGVALEDNPLEKSDDKHEIDTEKNMLKLTTLSPIVTSTENFEKITSTTTNNEQNKDTTTSFYDKTEKIPDVNEFIKISSSDEKIVSRLKTTTVLDETSTQKYEQKAETTVNLVNNVESTTDLYEKSTEKEQSLSDQLPTTIIPNSDSRPLGTLSTELTGSLTSMINQISEPLPAILPVAPTSDPSRIIIDNVNDDSNLEITTIESITFGSDESTTTQSIDDSKTTLKISEATTLADIKDDNSVSTTVEPNKIQLKINEKLENETKTQPPSIENLTNPIFLIQDIIDGAESQTTPSIHMLTLPTEANNLKANKIASSLIAGFSSATDSKVQETTEEIEKMTESSTFSTVQEATSSSPKEENNLKLSQPSTPEIILTEETRSPVTSSPRQTTLEIQTTQSSTTVSDNFETTVRPASDFTESTPIQVTKIVSTTSKLSEVTKTKEDVEKNTNKPPKAESPVVRIDISPEASQHELPNRIQLVDLPIVTPEPVKNEEKPNLTTASVLKTTEAPLPSTTLNFSKSTSNVSLKTTESTKKEENNDRIKYNEDSGTTFVKITSVVEPSTTEIPASSTPVFSSSTPSTIIESTPKFKPVDKNNFEINVKKTESETTPEHKWTLIPQQNAPSGLKVNKPPKGPSAEAPLSNPVRISDDQHEVRQPPIPLDASQGISGLDASIRNTSSDIINFAKLCNELAFNYWMATNKGLSTARSLALSPFGMTSLLAMIFLGARGPTSDQMNEILRLDDVATFNPHLVFQNVTDAVSLARNQGIANAAFVRELFADKAKVRKLMPFYKDQAQQFYEGLVAEVNFATISDLVRRRTNLLIRKQTGGRIKDFVKTNTVSLRSPLAALSANVFQTECNVSSASSEGRNGELYFAVSPAVRQRKLVPVPATVWKSNVLAGYEPSLDATAVALGDAGKLVSTIFVIPGQQGFAAPGDTLDRLEQRLVRGAFNDGSWNKLLKVLIPRPSLELQVPKFSHRSVINATAALKRMGLDELFSRHADLKGINGIGNQLHLADVLQMNLFSTCGDENMANGRHHVEIYPASPFRNSRAHEQTDDDDVSVDDEEVEDGRSSGASADGESYDDAFFERHERRARQATSQPSQDRPRLKLDRPFLYFVRHNPTGLLLHMGRFNPRLLP